MGVQDASRTKDTDLLLLLELEASAIEELNFLEESSSEVDIQLFPLRDDLMIFACVYI